MRIVGGAWRGRTFDAPEGRLTRPTTDRMRESIASMVLSECNLDLSDKSVLDAFAGSGGMGLELLSRGARHCTFCERDRRTAALVRKNCLSLVPSTSRWHIVVADAIRLSGHGALRGAPFDIVFLDPPYAMAASDVSELIGSLGANGMLGKDCLVVYERAAKGNELSIEGFGTVRSKRHGSTCVDLLRGGKTR